jgi:hypothetical protein
MARRALWKGLVAGGAAGLAASLAMNQFQAAWSKAEQRLSGEQRNGSSGSQSTDESEDATMKTAAKLAGIAGYQLSREQKKKASPVVHYAFGAGMGAIYGAVMELGPRKLRQHDFWSGLGWGVAIFVGADEIAVPAMGLSGPPSESPLSSHVYAFASHLVYGLTTGGMRKAVRAAL